MPDIIVIGGGAAGCMAALSAAKQGACVALIERNSKLGRKLYITGKGRCNLTNDSTAEQVLKHIPGNGRFLTSAVTRFPPAETMSFFEALGVPLKTERGGRVFPCSDQAADVIDALLMALRRARVDLLEDRAEHIVTQSSSVCGIKAEHGEHKCKAIILATGGISYPRTGSTGDGYRMAAELGHTIVPPKPSLVPLVAEGDICSRMQGLSLRNVSIQVKNSKNKVVFTEMGELLFTHFGLSGPLILSASAHMRDFASDRYVLTLDLKPALDEKMLDTRLLRDFSENSNRNFHHVLEGLVPRLLVPILVEQTGIAGMTKAHSITKEQRRKLLETLKGLTVPIQGPRPIAEAIVTSGGVKTSEVRPNTMESKLISGLYLAGEVLDVDAYTGGYNLQIAWSTGHAAGTAAYASLFPGETAN